MSYEILTDIVKKSSVPNCLIIYGDEDFLIDDTIRLIKDKYINKDYESLNFMQLEKLDNNFKEFNTFCGTYPVFSENKMCVIQESIFLTSSSSLSEHEEKQLINTIDNIHESLIIIFVMKGHNVDSRKKLVKKIKEKNAVFEIKKLNENDLTKYITKQFKELNLEISMGNANYIANNSGYLEYESTLTLYTINNELKKLYSYVKGNKQVSLEEIENVMVKSVESNIFKLVDYICEGNKKKAYEMIEEMLINNTPEQYIIHMLVRQYRMIYQYVILQNKGYSYNEILNKMKIKNFIGAKISKIARTLDAKTIEEYMEKFLIIDKKIKTGEMDSKIGLELINNGIIK